MACISHAGHLAGHAGHPSELTRCTMQAAQVCAQPHTPSQGKHINTRHTWADGQVNQCIPMCQMAMGELWSVRGYSGCLVPHWSGK